LYPVPDPVLLADDALLPPDPPHAATVNATVAPIPTN